jgi:hypothetical protein
MKTLLVLLGVLTLVPRFATGACRDLLVAGGESASTDCQLEVQVVNPNNTPFFDRLGRVNPRQACRDGDASCDADGVADGVCTYQVASCFHCVDPRLPTCVPITTESYGIYRPSPQSRRPVDVENAEAMIAAVLALGGTRGGPAANVVTFTPPIDDGTCTDLVPFKVPLRQTILGARPGNTLLRSRAIAGPRWDADFVRLQCLPAE